MLEQEKEVTEQGEEYTINYHPISEKTTKQYNNNKSHETDLNKSFELEVKEWEEKLKSNLEIESLDNLPPIIREGFTNFQKKLKIYYEKYATSNAEL